MNKREINITEATINILLEIDGSLYAVAMDKDKLEAISFLIKNSVEDVVQTNKTQSDLIRFIGLS